MRVSGPLFGDSASGKFAGLLSFSTKRGQAVASFEPEARKYSSPALIAHRAFYSAACASWSALSAFEKSEYSAAASYPSTGFQYFLSLFASSTPYIGVYAEGASGWESCFDSEGFAIHGEALFLIPGFSAGFFLFNPVDLSSILYVMSYDFDFDAFLFPNDSCGLFFAASASDSVPPLFENFFPVSLVDLQSVFPLGSSCSGLFLWVLILADIS